MCESQIHIHIHAYSPSGAGRVPENKSGRGFEGNNEGKYLTISPGGTAAPQSNYDIDLLAFDYAWMKHGRQLVAPGSLNFLADLFCQYCHWRIAPPCCTLIFKDGGVGMCTQ